MLLAAWQKLDELRDPEAFGPWLLRSARNAAVTRIRKEARSSAVGDMGDLARMERAPVACVDEDLADLCHRGQLAQLLWDAAEALSPADQLFLDLHVRQGLGTAELAELLDVTTNNVHQKWFRVRRRLAVAVEARLIWRGGAAGCGELARRLRAAGVTTFGQDAVAVVSDHVADCPLCARRRAVGTDPAVLFDGAAPSRAAHDVGGDDRVARCQPVDVPALPSPART
ncbi:MAG: putative polymerase subfamily sigma factor [Acidimicrobiales bacterium]|nr:putative polymerase subfamily sigma factor [Acidimicrobiales bacterium]